MKKLIVLFSLIVVVTHVSTAQGKKTQLEAERQNIQKQIADLQKTYNDVRGQRKTTLRQLAILNERINLQERYLNNVNEEIRYINAGIDQSSSDISKLQKQLDTFKAQYSRSVVYTYKNRSTYDFLSFIFSSMSFNDAIKRIAYLKSYRSYREQQVSSIIETQQQIQNKKQLQIGQVIEKKLAIRNRAKQVEVLQAQKREKNETMDELKSQEKELKRQIAAKQKRDRDLKKAVTTIVFREMKKAQARVFKTTVVNSNAGIADAYSNKTTGSSKADQKDGYVDLNARDQTLNADFFRNKGILPWPVDNGFPSIHFGIYQVEGTKDLKGNNPGLTISTPLGAIVKSVFKGEVVAVANLGDGMMVAIRHGKYFTVYSNLSSVSVSKGMGVSTGDAIGKVGQSDYGNGGQIDFILMIESKNVNPEPWLRRR